MHKQVIIMRDDLNMRKGKLVAQGAHASLGALLSQCDRGIDAVMIPMNANIGPWLTDSFTKVCVRITGQMELEKLVHKAKELGLPACLITDNGKTEFNGIPTVTCAAIGPGPAETVDLVTSHLKLL